MRLERAFKQADWPRRLVAWRHLDLAAGGADLQRPGGLGGPAHQLAKEQPRPEMVSAATRLGAGACHGHACTRLCSGGLKTVACAGRLGVTLRKAWTSASLKLGCRKVTVCEIRSVRLRQYADLKGGGREASIDAAAKSTSGETVPCMDVRTRARHSRNAGRTEFVGIAVPPQTGRPSWLEAKDQRTTVSSASHRSNTTKLPMSPKGSEPASQVCCGTASLRRKSRDQPWSLQWPSRFASLCNSSKHFGQARQHYLMAASGKAFTLRPTL